MTREYNPTLMMTRFSSFNLAAIPMVRVSNGGTWGQYVSGSKRRRYRLISSIWPRRRSKVTKRFEHLFVSSCILGCA